MRETRMRGRLVLLTFAAVGFGMMFVGPAGAATPVCQPKVGIASCSLVISGNQALGTLKATATFTIAAGFQDVRVSLASYTKSGPKFAVTYPQQLFSSDTGLFDAGGPYTLQVLLPDPCGFYQVDLAKGTVIAPQIANQAAGYRALGRLMAAATGGFDCDTRTIGYWKTHASCGTVSGQPVLDQTLKLASGGYVMLGQLKVDTCVEAVRILGKSRVDTGANMASNAAFKMAAQLLATRLNLRHGTGTCPALNAAISEALQLLNTIGFTGTGAPTMTAAQATRAGQLATLFDDYNNNGVSAVC